MVSEEVCDVIRDNINSFEYRDGKLFRLKSKRSDHIGEVIGSLDTHGYRQTRIKGKSVLMHRIIWFILYGDFPEQIDHIDRDRSNNHHTNLRASDNSKNQHNREIGKNNTSGVMGVNFKKELNKWAARISVKGIRKNLGYFDSKEIAIQVRLAAELEERKLLFKGDK